MNGFRPEFPEVRRISVLSLSASVGNLSPSVEISTRTTDVFNRISASQNKIIEFSCSK